MTQIPEEPAGRSWRGPATAPARARRLALAAAAVVLVAGLVCTALAHGTARVAYDEAVSAHAAARAETAQVLHAGTSSIARARQTLDDSAGKVLSEEPRTVLAEAIGVESARISAASRELAKPVGVPVPRDVSWFAPGSGLRAGAAELAHFRFPAAGPLKRVSAELSAPVRGVLEAVAAWQAEQDRILRERYTNNVHALGWYPELDACAGSVDVSAHYQDIPTIAEHWSCGGRDFPDDAGTLITLTGVHTGTYRVEGIVAMLNASRNDSADLPRGYDLLYQTCQNGTSSTMSFTGLTRVD